MQTIPVPDSRGPNVFVVSEEAHFELCKMRAHLRLMTRILDPNAVGAGLQSASAYVGLVVHQSLEVAQRISAGDALVG